MKILIADDDSFSRQLLQGLLTKWGYEVTAAQDGNAAWDHLITPGAPRMVLLDWMMPGRNGVDVCRKMRKLRPEPYTYILLVTSKDAKESIVEGLESGADDYLTKPYNPHELKARIRVGMRVLQLEDNLVQAREAMRYKATHDALTGIWNRGSILETLDREVIRARREGLSLGVLIADLDHFKHVNDVYGHLTGDAALREAAQRMQSDIRPYDALGRFGGEEFLILLPNCGRVETEDKAERLRRAINLHPFETMAGQLNLTTSIGGIATGDWPGDTVSQILQMADSALYRAKQEGRDRTAMAGLKDHEDAHKQSMVLSSQGPNLP